VRIVRKVCLVARETIAVILGAKLEVWDRKSFRQRITVKAEDVLHHSDAGRDINAEYPTFTFQLQ
jgi:hypothetical protein